jgi:hypothetical protein
LDEEVTGVDHNDDGDADDSVVQIVDVATGAPTDTQLAVTEVANKGADRKFKLRFPWVR